LVAALRKATRVPSALMLGELAVALPALPLLSASTRM